jgi:hypothetical protein
LDFLVISPYLGAQQEVPQWKKDVCITKEIPGNLGAVCQEPGSKAKYCNKWYS